MKLKTLEPLPENEKIEEEKGDNRFHSTEKTVTGTVGSTIEIVSARAGYDSVNWLLLTKGLVYITLILTMFEGFQNPEIVTLTVCLLTLYRLEYRETTKRSDMR